MRKESAFRIDQMKHQLDANLCGFYFRRVTLHVSGVKRTSSGVLKTGTAATGTCVIVAGRSSHHHIWWCDDLPAQHCAGFISAGSLYMFRASSAHHQEYLKLVQRPLVHVLSLQVSHHISLLGPEALIRRCDDWPAAITDVPVAAVLVLNTPDDGRLRPKHVEWLCRNKTCIVLHQVGVSFELLTSFKESC